jgi:hypothetical protein
VGPDAAAWDRGNAAAQHRLIEDRLDLSRIIVGKLRLDVDVIDVSAVVSGEVATVEPGADAKGLTNAQQDRRTQNRQNSSAISDDGHKCDLKLAPIRGPVGSIWPVSSDVRLALIL